MKIGELAARANLNASAIRCYEKLGLLAAPQRIGGQRRYPSVATPAAPSSATSSCASPLTWASPSRKSSSSSTAWAITSPSALAGKNSPAGNSSKSNETFPAPSNSNLSSRAFYAAIVPLSSSASPASALAPTSVASLGAADDHLHGSGGRNYPDLGGSASLFSSRPRIWLDIARLPAEGPLPMVSNVP